jgi:hypothetical protein
MEVGAAVELGDTLLLRLMDGEETIEYLRVTLARVLVFDELDQFPDGMLTRVVGGRHLTAQTLAEAFTELEFVVGGQVWVVEIVVAVGIEEAVGEQGRSEFHRLAEKGLQAAGGPGIAAGLNGVGHAEGGVKAARIPRELSADGQKFVGEELVDSPSRPSAVAAKPGKRATMRCCMRRRSAGVRGMRLASRWTARRPLS